MTLRGGVACGNHLSVFQAQYGSHSTLPGRHGLLHVATTLGHQAHAIRKAQRLCAHQRGVFTETVTGEIIGTRAMTLLPYAPYRHPSGEHRRLSLVGLVEHLCRTLLHQLPKVIIQCLGGFSERRRHHRIGASQFRQHAYGLRTLAGKNKC